MSGLDDRWAAGSAYEDYMGRWSRALAARFVAWLGVRPGAHWLDVGCGTGAMTVAICAAADPASVTGCDPSAAFVEYAREHSRDPRASFVVAGAGSLPSRVGGFDTVTSSLVLNFIPDTVTAVREMATRCVAGGTVSACVWDYSEGMQFLRKLFDAAVALDDAARAHDEGLRFPLCRPEPLHDAFRRAGLADVCCEPIEIPTTFAGFDDFWRPFLAGTGPAPSYVVALPADRRAALAQLLERTLPRAAGGAIELT